MKNFARIGTAGYVPPRHMKTLQETGSNLLAALETNESARIIDNFFLESDRFVEGERFDRHIDELQFHNRDMQVKPRILQT